MVRGDLSKSQRCDAEQSRRILQRHPAIGYSPGGSVARDVVAPSQAANASLVPTSAGDGADAVLVEQSGDHFVAAYSRETTYRIDDIFGRFARDATSPA